MGFRLAAAVALLANTTALSSPLPDRAGSGAGIAHPTLWPKAHSVGLVDAKTEAFVTGLDFQTSYANAPKAQLYGAEFEAQKARILNS